MTLNEFEPSVVRLRSVYGEKIFPPERLDILYRAVQYVSLDIWTEALDLVIGEHMMAPNVNKIKEAVYAVRKTKGDTADAWEPLRERIRATQKLPEDKNCRQCWGGGTLYCYLKDDPHQYQYVKICDCAAGEVAAKLPENKRLRKWDLIVAATWHIDGVTDRNVSNVVEISPVKNLSGIIRNLSGTNDLNAAIGEPTPPKKKDQPNWWDTDR